MGGRKQQLIQVALGTLRASYLITVNLYVMYPFSERGPVTLQLKSKPQKLKQNYSTYNFHGLLL